MSDNTYLDGCGIHRDLSVGKDTRILFQLDDDRQQDISVHLEDGVLHIYGVYRPLIVMPEEANRIGITTEFWPKENVNE